MLLITFYILSLFYFKISYWFMAHALTKVILCIFFRLVVLLPRFHRLMTQSECAWYFPLTFHYRAAWAQLFDLEGLKGQQIITTTCCNYNVYFLLLFHVLLPILLEIYFLNFLYRSILFLSSLWYMFLLKHFVSFMLHYLYYVILLYNKKIVKWLYPMHSVFLKR